MAFSPSRQENEDIQRLVRELVSEFERRDESRSKLEARVALLEAREEWYRALLYPWLITLAVAIPFANPPALPD